VTVVVVLGLCVVLPTIQSDIAWIKEDIYAKSARQCTKLHKLQGFAHWVHVTNVCMRGRSNGESRVE